jgi:MATE family multidrug resistance protein
LENHADALNHPWPSFWIFLGGVLLNIVLAWMWIYGHLGFRSFGLEGAASATLVARIVTAAAIFVWLMKSSAVRIWWPRSGWFKPLRFHSFRDLLAIGVPASLQLLTEVTAFAAASLIIGTLGIVPLAAHQVALTCASTTFMVPLGWRWRLRCVLGKSSGPASIHACAGFSSAAGFMRLPSWERQ